MTPDRRTITEAGETLAKRQSALLRRDSADILDRLSVPRNSRQKAVLTEQQAAAGHILRMHHAAAQISIKTTWDTIEDRVDISRGAPMWGPPGGGGSELSRRWLYVMERTLAPIDAEIAVLVAVKRKEPRQVFDALQDRGFMNRPSEVYTHIRRAFEGLRIYCDGA